MLGPVDIEAWQAEAEEAAAERTRGTTAERPRPLAPPAFLAVPAAFFRMEMDVWDRLLAGGVRRRRGR